MILQPDNKQARKLLSGPEFNFHQIFIHRLMPQDFFYIVIATVKNQAYEIMPHCFSSSPCPNTPSSKIS